MKQLSRAYHGPWDDPRDADRPRPGQLHLVRDAPPRRRGTAAASCSIGDAVHTCPPTIAQGGAMGLEDAVVLAELLTARDALDQDLWDAFHARRFERAKRSSTPRTSSPSGSSSTSRATSRA